MTLDEAELIIERHRETLERELKLADIAFHDKKRIISNLHSCEIMRNYLLFIRFDIPVKWIRQSYLGEIITLPNDEEIRA